MVATKTEIIFHLFRGRFNSPSIHLSKRKLNTIKKPQANVAWGFFVYYLG